MAGLGKAAEAELTHSESGDEASAFIPDCCRVVGLIAEFATCIETKTYFVCIYI